MAIILFPKKNYKKQAQMFLRNYSLAWHMGVATNSELGGGEVQIGTFFVS